MGREWATINKCRTGKENEGRKKRKKKNPEKARLLLLRMGYVREIWLQHDSGALLLRLAPGLSLAS